MRELAGYCWRLVAKVQEIGLMEPSTESSTHLAGGSAHLTESSAHLDIDSASYKRLVEIANPAREKKKLPAREMDQIILSLCAVLPLSLAQIADLVGRNPRTIQVHYLARLIKEGRLAYGMPSDPTHPRQTYVTKQ